ncbi:MAG TPA: LacI family DNA-binding transcriptional regulator [Aggregatilineales bacterium]|nr:LacI family DNA-binding transcriptional regulator [Aggregatilineales bacterium]
MPTLLDVARAAGVSTATVSKVLSNTPYFTEATRAKVMQAVDELGYVPNLAARALSSGKTHIIAVVFPYVYDALFTDPLVLRILEGIEAELTKRGYNILLSTPRLRESGPDTHYTRLIRSGYIEGVIALDSVPMASVLEIVRQRKMPAVAIGYHPNTYSIRSDDHQGGQLQMEHIIRLGHHKIGIIASDESLHFSIEHRLKGLQHMAEQHGLSYQQMPRANGDFSIDSGAKAARQLLTEHPDLTALLCLNDRMAMGAIQTAQAMGRQVPDDLSVIGYDNIPLSMASSPALTTIDQQAPELGRIAATMLFEVFDGKQPATATLPTTLIVRQSSSHVLVNNY